jgi:hypothetical protein
MGPVGFPELLVFGFFGLFWVIPIVAGIWALVTLHRLRTGQDEVRRRLTAIEMNQKR